MAHRPAPLLEIHPADAEPLGLVDGDLARIESPHGAVVLPVALTSQQRRGELFAPMHWTDRVSSAGPIDRLVGAAVDPVSGQPELKATPVRVMPVAVQWHGLLLRGTDAALDGPFYWARVPLDHGHVVTLAGWQPLANGPDSETWIATLLDVGSAAELVIYADPTRGTFRYAALVDGRLAACLFLARDAAALPRLEALTPLGSAIAANLRPALLAGRHPGPPAASDPTVCACFAVGARTLRQTIATRRLTTVAEIGAALRAGTNCGSCIPELKALLSDARTGPVSAA